MAQVPASGAQHEIWHGDQRAVVVEVGGGLREYTVAGRAVLEGYRADEMADGARAQTLVPWPNRLRDGQFTWRGEQFQTALSEPDKRNALHGLVRWANWDAIEHAADHVAMAYTLHAQQGWPFPLRLHVDYRLGDGGLSVRASATNLGDVDCPYAAGAHPYLTVGTPHIDDAELAVPAATWYPTDERQIPVGREPVAGTACDFREPRRIGAQQIDFAYTDLDRERDGRARVRLIATGGATVALWLDTGYPYVEIFTGDTLAPHRRRTGLGVEPMTCAPNGLQSGDGLVTLAPGETSAATWGIEASKRG